MFYVTEEHRILVEVLERLRHYGKFGWKRYLGKLAGGDILGKFQTAEESDNSFFAFKVIHSHRTKQHHSQTISTFQYY